MSCEKGLHSGLMSTKSGCCSFNTFQNNALSAASKKSQLLSKSKLAGTVVLQPNSSALAVTRGGENSSHILKVFLGLTSQSMGQLSKHLLLLLWAIARTVSELTTLPKWFNKTCECLMIPTVLRNWLLGS